MKELAPWWLLFSQNEKMPLTCLQSTQSSSTIRTVSSLSASRLITEAITFCGEQQVTLTGFLCLEKPPKKDGNFHVMVYFCANFGDNNLKEHIVNYSGNASHISTLIQNEIINVCGSPSDSLTTYRKLALGMDTLVRQVCVGSANLAGKLNGVQ
ncbi:hypothetical protein PR048_018946 [Dryococelus australis]|uniref:Uncharacterized protein n=1 Tax=Dryococelus australis TaxID=614101 RepID=A0ABQ9H233_9NEOP|nr:hypothetical protein PR048_018946 [Dryococelus australis]